MNVPRNSTTRGRRATVSVSAAVVSASLLLGACGVSNKSDTESVSARSAGTESPERERSNTTVAPTTEATTETAPEGASSGATMLKDAIRATAEATSFQAKASLALNGLPDGDATILSVDGGYDTQAKRGQFLIEVGQLPAMSGTVAEIPTPSGPVEVVVDGSTVYVRADELAALNNGKPWTSIDLSDLGGLAGATPPPAGADIPDQVLGALEGAFGNVETVGREDVDGASTTHLRVALDLNAIVEEMLSAVESEMPQMDMNITLPELPVDVWVGDDGMVHRVRVEFALGEMLSGFEGMTFNGPEGAENAVLVFDLVLSGLGEPVAITVPDPAQVAPLSLDALGGLGLEGFMPEG